MNNPNDEKKSVNKVVVAVAVVLLAVVLAVSGILIKNKLELSYVKKQTDHFMQELKAGYIEENDYDIPVEIYGMITENWNEIIKKVAEYCLGGEEQWRRGWDSVLKYMEYTIDSVEKTEEGYEITITVQNRDLTLIMTETATALWENKNSLAAGALTGKATSMFWDSFESVRDETNTVITATYKIHIQRDEEKNWLITYNPQMLGSAAGIDSTYLKALPEEDKIVISSK